MASSNFLAKAQQMMTDPSFWDNVDAVERSRHNGKGSVSHEKNINSGDMMEESMEFPQIPQQPQRMPKMASEIMESFAQQPPIQGDSNLMTEIPDSYMSKIDKSMMRMGGMPQGGYQRPQQQYQQQMMNETTRYQQQPMAPQNGGVDYNYLKFLVTEAVKECMQSLMNESRFYGLVLKDNGIIQVLNKKGDLYEAELKLKKKRQ